MKLSILILCFAGLLLSSALGAAAAALPSVGAVVVDSHAAAVIVLAERPTAVSRYAAQEIRYHVAKACGASLPIVNEATAFVDAGFRIYVGDTRAARAAGIDAGALAPETFVLQTAKGALYIAGRDTGGNPLDSNTSAGTLFGVYEWLERDLGVRWVWPGELGTYVPKRSTLVVHEVRARISPKFFQRHVRTNLSADREHPALGFTPQAAEKFEQEQAVFLRRNRMGRSVRISYRHAFTDWWKQYGRQHPEWFQLVNGKRGPTKPGARYSMCVSNPGLQQEILKQWRAQRGDDTGSLPDYINAVENDFLGQCECEKCRAWDGPQPKSYSKFTPAKSKIADTRFVSDRYARFALELQKLAAKENPKAVVVSYAYLNYFQPPTSGIKLNRNILIGFCPPSWWYPRSAKEQGWVKKQWDGWQKTGARVFLRTNFFLDGYCMPFIFAHQFADDFRNASRNGLTGTDFDSLTGQWSTQGPNLYLLMRLQTRPEASTESLLAEYHSAFGPAAVEVKAYFQYWESYTTANREKINHNFERLEASRWRRWAKAANVVFPEECFAPAEAILQRAAAKAAGDSEAAARVAFLQKGLEHAQLSSRVAGVLTSHFASEEDVAHSKEALDALLAFRRANEMSGIANFDHLAWIESESWELSDETRQAPELYP